MPVIPQAGNICLRCQQRDGTSILKLLIKFNLATAPPGTPPEATVCPSCDQVWDTIGQAKLPRKAGNAAPQVSNNRSMASFTASASMYQPIIHLDQAPPIPQAYNNLSAYVPPTSYVQQPQQQQQQYPNPYTSSSSNRFPPMQEEASFSFVSHHSNPPRANSSVASSNSSHNIINLEDMGNDDTQSCGCGVPCKLLTVNKEGPNKGRKFYSCPKPR